MYFSLSIKLKKSSLSNQTKDMVSPSGILYTLNKESHGDDIIIILPVKEKYKSEVANYGGLLYDNNTLFYL